MKSEEVEKIEKRVMSLLEKAKRLDALQQKVEELEQQQQKLEKSIKNDYEKIQELKGRMQKKNKKLRKIREEKKQIEAEIKDVQKLLKALGILEKAKTKKQNTKVKQKYVLVPKKPKSKVQQREEYRNISKVAKRLCDISKNTKFLEVQTLDDLVRCFKETYPYSQVKESKTVMYFYI